MNRQFFSILVTAAFLLYSGLTLACPDASVVNNAIAKTSSFADFESKSKSFGGLEQFLSTVDFHQSNWEAVKKAIKDSPLAYDKILRGAKENLCGYISRESDRGTIQVFLFKK